MSHPEPSPAKTPAMALTLVMLRSRCDLKTTVTTSALTLPRIAAAAIVFSGSCQSIAVSLRRQPAPPSRHKATRTATRSRRVNGCDMNTIMILVSTCANTTNKQMSQITIKIKASPFNRSECLARDECAVGAQSIVKAECVVNEV